jgi:hypothetical protein
MEIKSYYAFLNIAGITPLCEKLLQTDRYPALRLILTFKKAMCGDDNSLEYVKEGKFDENAFSNDVIGFYPEQIKKLKVSPEKEEQFWNIVHLIFRKFIHFMSTVEGIPDQDRLAFLKEHYSGIRTTTFLAAAFGNENFNSLMTYLKEIISELEKKIIQTSSATIADTSLSEQTQLANKANNKGKGLGAKQNKRTSEKSGPKYLSFEMLFNDKKMIEPLIKYLKRDRIKILDDNGKWLGLSRKKTEAMGFIEALRKRTLINFTTAEEVGTAFKNKFQIDIVPRSFTLKTRTREDYFETYLRIIDDFLLEYNKSKPPHKTT